NNDFIVLSADAVTDCDLSAAINFHKSNKADATIVIKSVSDPREYGLVNIDQNNNITGFIEKPGYSQVNTNTANTGIYILNKKILDLIPDNQEYDFAKDVFPKMLKQNMKLMAYKSDFYWCDIGDLKSFLECQKDILNKKVNCNIKSKFNSDGNIFKSTKPNGIYKINPPVYIGENVKIENGAIIEAGSVIEDNSIIGENTKIRGCNIQERVLINDRSSLIDSIICSGSTIKKDCHLFEGSVVGFGTVIGNSVTIYPGVKIWPQKFINNNIIITDNIKYSNIKREYIDDDGITGEAGAELTPEFLVKIGSALGSITSDSVIAVGSNDSPFAVSLKNALIAGVQSTGTSVWNFGNNFESLFLFGMTSCNLKLGVFINGEKNGVIKIFSEGGLPPTRQLERALEATISSGEYNRCRWNDFPPQLDMSGFEGLYQNTLKSQAPFGLKNIKAIFKSKNPLIESTMNKIISDLGANLSDDIIINIDKFGSSLSIQNKNTNNLKNNISYWQVFLVCCLSEFEKGNDIAIPIDSPQIIDKLAQSYNTKVYRYFSSPADNSDETARNIAKKQIWVRDVLMLSIKFLSFLKLSNKSINQIEDMIPKFCLYSKTILFDNNIISEILNNLTQNNNLNYKISEGILIDYKNGSALIRPFKRGNGLKILAEASKAEFANEICENISELIKNSIK
ncbi:MAG: hypothetical protein J6C55_02750, partial [Oscillospiraceae bacterium]|nr:hypothetical protein [Oscillospiraceae bacterium]